MSSTYALLDFAAMRLEAGPKACCVTRRDQNTRVRTCPDYPKAASDVSRLCCIPLTSFKAVVVVWSIRRVLIQEL
jgi:hypothetical protein